MKCRHCNNELKQIFADLGNAPPSNAYLTKKDLGAPEKWLPLRVLVCEKCLLVQTEDFTEREILFQDDYAYFSSFSSTWLDHAERYVKEMVDRFNLNSQSHVVEVASNDGYLLQYIVAKNIPCTGIEPTKSTAVVARSKGITVLEEFFGIKLAKKLVDQGKQADLLVANNVLAHVPDINDFLSGFALLLKCDGVATFEFPHLLRLIEENQYDTIYHEHFSYLSFLVVNNIFSANGLTVFDVEELQTHGGSLRVFAQRTDTKKHSVTNKVQFILKNEELAGLGNLDYYRGMNSRLEKLKNDFLIFLINAKNNGKSVAAYGAAAKGNTLLNYAGIRSDLISYVVDKNPAKEGKYMPGSHIPIVNENYIKINKPDYVVILPWNLADEIKNQLKYIREWSGSFVLAVPYLKID